MSEIRAVQPGVVFPILIAVSFGHLLNDTMQAVLPATYPLIKENFHLNFAQVGLITLCFQLTASLLQPVVGFYTDRRPKPYSLPVGMALTLIGLLLLAWAGTYDWVLGGAALIGMGSSIFHPEASRLARLASGGKHGFAQSLFQVGGNFGSSIGPLLAAAIVVPHGQKHIAWFSLIALLGFFILLRVSGWYRQHLAESRPATYGSTRHSKFTRRQITGAISLLIALMFSKFFYLACMSSYYTFYLIHKFHVSVQMSQIYLFVFLASVAAGTLLGGPIGDRVGRKIVIWISILGVAPFSFILPHVGLPWVIALSMPIGFLLASAFPAIVVYATELMPGKVGMIAGLFFGFAFGMGGVGSAVLGALADHTSIEFVFFVVGFLPLLGVLAWLLPEEPAKSASPLPAGKV